MLAVPLLHGAREGWSAWNADREKPMDIWKTTLLGGLALGNLAGAARPFDTDDAGTVAPGTFEVEIGSQSWSRDLALCTGLKHGLTERMDLGIAMGYSAWPEAERAYDNAQLSVKFALVPTLLSASFSNELGTSEFSVRGILSKSFGDFHANLNLGGDFVGGQRDADLDWKLAPGYSIGPAVVGVELVGDQHEARSWKTGGQFLFSEWFAIDLGIGSSIADDPDWLVTAGVWFAFPSLEKKGP
jgi:hypothetical protein